jgi:Uma2 family endonuclease
LLVEIVAAELGVDLERVGSNTFKRADLQKGFEPDSAFYIQHAAEVSGKQRIDLTVDPPPDLVIEVDITNPSLPRLPIFAAVSVPEVWRYDGERVQILQLADRRYVEAERSVALPLLTSAVATQLMELSKTLKSSLWLRRVRDWVRAGGDLNF